jgi:hypothetical protein
VGYVFLMNYEVGFVIFILIVENFLFVRMLKWIWLYCLQIFLYVFFNLVFDDSD